ncbi:unnamed protein product [Effrenium voratum]|nr:unnamed protein product [Effrenium voratum]
MAARSYFVTVSPATAVECVLGPVALTRPDVEELAVIRGTTLDVFRWDQRLVKVCGGPINENVCCMLAAPSETGRHLLVLITVSLQILIVRCDDAKSMQLLGTADLGNVVLGTTARPAACCVGLYGPSGPSGASKSARVAVYLYSGIVAVADLAGLEARFAQFGVVDLKSVGKMSFVNVGEEVVCLDLVCEAEDIGDATLVALHGREEDGEEGQRFLCVHSLDLRKRGAAQALPGAVKVPDRRYMEASLVAAVPPTAATWVSQGAILALGSGSIQLFDTELTLLQSLKGGGEAPTLLVKANSSGSRWLVAGACGDIYLLRLDAGAFDMTAEMDAGQPGPLVVQCLGISVPASGIATWGDFAFVGSQVADSEVLKLRAPSASAPASALSAAGRRRNNLEDAFEVLDTWNNLGPIKDFCTKGPAAEMVTCSGVGDVGSLRFIQMGIPVEELGCSAGFSGVLGLWPLGSRLVFARPGRTDVLKLAGGAPDFGLELCAAEGLSQEETLLCCSVGTMALQVTRSGVQVLSLGLARVAQWTPKKPLLTAAEIPGAGALVATVSDVSVLELGAQGITEAASWRLPGEPSCLAAGGGVLAVGLWSEELCIFHREDKDLAKLALPSLPRSLAFARLGRKLGLQLFVGLLDGTLLSFRSLGGAWHLQRRVVVGLQPVRLVVVPHLEGEREIGPCLQPEGETEDAAMLIAMSGHGIILQAAANAQRIVHSQICLPGVSHAAFFSHGLAGIQHCMAFISQERLLLARLRCGHRMHVQTLQLPQAPLRISHHRSTHICAVGCGDLPTATMPAPRTRAQLLFVSEAVTLLDTWTLGPDEQIASLLTVTLGDAEYIAVGTAVVLESEPEPSRGQVRLLAPCAASSSEAAAPFRVVATVEVQGAVYTLAPLAGRLLGAVNNRLQLWELVVREGQCRLMEVCRYAAGVIVLDIQTMGHCILAGDIMRSVTMFRFDPEEKSISMVAYDQISAWSTAVAMLSDNHFLCSDDCGNLTSLCCQAAPSAPSAPENEVKILERVGCIHSGELVNRFRKGVLGLQANQMVDTTIWASASGAFGLVLPIPCEKRFARLLLLQDALGRELKPMLPHEDWRNARLDLQGDKKAAHEGFIDGDLVEQFLDMPREKQEALVAPLEEKLGVNALEELLQDVEALSQLH